MTGNRDGWRKPSSGALICRSCQQPPDRTGLTLGPDGTLICADCAASEQQRIRQHKGRGRSGGYVTDVPAPGGADQEGTT